MTKVDDIAIDMTSNTGNLEDAMAAMNTTDKFTLDLPTLVGLLHQKSNQAQIPRFLPYDVDLWHSQCMANFAVHQVQNENDMYSQVIAKLQPEVLKHVTAYMSAPRQNQEFSGLVEALKFAYSQSDGEKMEFIFNCSLGDQKPSHLYYSMRRMWLDPNPDESKVFRHLFIRKLPKHIAVLLRSSVPANITEFLQAADNMVDQNRQHFSAAMNVNDVSSSEHGQEKIGTYRTKFNQDDKKTRKQPKAQFNDKGICYYHDKFGERAYKCYSGCKYVETKSKTVNATSITDMSYEIDNDNKFSLPCSWNQHKAVKLQQNIEGKQLLVDTGTYFSLVPARKHELLRKPNNSLFKGAQGLPIPVYGKRKILVDIGTGRKFLHTFFVAGVQEPLLGLDFLLEHRLAVDPVHNRLFDADTYIYAKTKSVYVQAVTCQHTEGFFSHLWKEFPSLCDASVAKLTNTPKHSIVHDIELKPGTQPTHAKARRLFGIKLQAAKDEIEGMLKLGIIRRSKSEWASPLHIVPKGNDSFRPCGDFRKLNYATVPDRYPVPHIQDCTRDLQGAKYFSKIDLVRAFHQIPLSKEAIPKTAIITPFGLFEFLRMPFGLCNAAQAFQRLMDVVCRQLPGVFVYIDDILVASKNKDEHEAHLRKLFARLTQYGLVVNPMKSILGSKEVNFLGFKVDANGVSPTEEKVKAILDFPQPVKYGQLSEFLGIVNFYHRFIPKCSEIAKPLYELLKLHNSKKNSSKSIQQQCWKKEHDNAFQDLKRAIADTSTLSYPSHKTKTRLVTDASDVAIGAVMEQWHEECWRPIAFYSKALKGPEMKYSAYDRELLAIKQALQHFRHIIEGLPNDLFHIATDHKPLTTGKNFNTTSQNKTQLNRIERTWEYIGEITTDIRHISGKNNPVADALSRNNINTVHMEPLLNIISKEQEKAEMRPQNGIPWPEHWKVQKHFHVTLTVDTRANTPRPVVPDAVTKMVFENIHGIAHQGVKATRRAISSSFVWPSMTKDISKWVNECQKCQSSKITRHNKSAFSHMPSPSGKFEAIHVDIVGPLPACKNYNYLLTIVDRFSRWPAAVPLTGITAKECANAIINGWIQYYGTPTSITTDRGRQFTSFLWQELCMLLGSTHNMTTAFHPQSNGMVERFHRQLKASLMAKLDNNTNWIQDLPIILLGIRTAIKDDLKVSSAEIVYGEPLRIPGIFFPEASTKSPIKLHDYVAELKSCMSQAKYKEPDWHGNDNPQDYVTKELHKCSHVFVLVCGMKSSLQRPYKGPYRVIKRDAKVFTIELPNGSTDTVSIDRLKPATTSPL